MDLFSFEDYKSYIRQRIRQFPKRGHGQYKLMAEHLNMSTVMISQIFNGDRHLSQEHAFLLQNFFGWTELETRYFLNLVQKERAGHYKLEKFYLEELQQLRLQASDLKQRVPQDKQLTEEEKATFYSRWYYSGIRLLTSVSGFDNIQAISERLDLPIETVNKVMQFLLQHGLCVQEDNKFKMGPSRIHLESRSPITQPRQVSWRLKAIEHMDSIEKNLFYTAPMSISEESFLEVKNEIHLLIDQLGKKVTSKKPDQLACLNIDLFEF